LSTFVSSEKFTFGTIAGAEIGVLEVSATFTSILAGPLPIVCESVIRSILVSSGCLVPSTLGLSSLAFSGLSSLAFLGLSSLAFSGLSTVIGLIGSAITGTFLRASAFLSAILSAFLLASLSAILLASLSAFLSAILLASFSAILLAFLSSLLVGLLSLVLDLVSLASSLSTSHALDSSSYKSFNSRSHVSKHFFFSLSTFSLT